MRQFRSTLGSGILAGALAAGMTIAGASLAVAQSSNGARPSAPPSAPAATPPSAAAASISDQELKTFAVAALEVRKINDSYRPRYQSADTPAEKQQVQKEATDKMAAAVSQKGLSVDKYNQIVRVAQADPEVAKQIDGYARAAQ
jgi:hypothetical protein